MSDLDGEAPLFGAGPDRVPEPRPAPRAHVVNLLGYLLNRVG
ncbi:MAG: hypothetical protein ACRYGI_15805 [Janthinobacterium lividum]